MDRGKKAVITVLADFVLLALIVFSVYRLLFGDDTSGRKNVFTACIVLAIPIMFFITYMAFAGDKFDYRPGMFDEDEDESEEEEAGREEEAGDTGTDIVPDAEQKASQLHDRSSNIDK